MNKKVITRLIVLGSITKRGSANGYHIITDMKKWGSNDKSTSIQPGSVYHALSKMAEEELLYSLSRNRNSTTHHATEYKLTDAGKAYFLTILKKCLQSTDLSIFSAGLAFMNHLESNEALQLLKSVREKHTQIVEHLNSVPLSEEINDPSANPELAGMWSSLHRTTVDYLDSLILSIEAEKYAFANPSDK